MAETDRHRDTTINVFLPLRWRFRQEVVTFGEGLRLLDPKTQRFLPTPEELFQQATG